MKDNKPQVHASVTQVQQWAGPLPAPDALAKYNEATPNAAERIIAMAEKEMEHRHKREDAIIEQDADAMSKEWKLALVSIILGFVCVLVLAFLVGYALYRGTDNIALGTAIGAIGAVAGLFTYGQISKARKKE
ncbi:MAG: DUF2335 domain-containing protein [Prevotella sp.]|nr:DUF2335 domain-containing protein [Prevotella sp.]